MNSEEKEAAMKDREEKRAKFKQMQPIQREGMEKAMIAKQWQWIAGKNAQNAENISKI